MKKNSLKLTQEQIEKIIVLLNKGHRVELKKKSDQVEIIKITRKKEQVSNKIQK